MANKNILIVIEREHKIKQSTAHKMKEHELILLAIPKKTRVTIARLSLIKDSIERRFENLMKRTELRNSSRIEKQT